MKRQNKNIERIEEALIQVHRSAALAEPGQFFQKKTMARILESGIVSQTLIPDGLNTGRLVWRLAVWSYLVVTVLAAHLMTSGVDSQYQISMFILGDSSSLDIFRTFGVM
jgi:hypothetical protein